MTNASVRALRRTLCVAIVAVAGGSVSVHASAQSPVADPAAQDAERLYAQGLRLLQEERPQEALIALDGSVKAFPSPNTDLLRGHALRTLGRRVEAMAAYERVVRDAGARVRGGDARFEATLADAGTWIAFLRTELGELAIEVRTGAHPATVTMDGQPLDLVVDRGAGIARARLWREPGVASIVARGESGVDQVAKATLVAGDSHSVSLDVTPPVGAVDHSPPVASWVAWGTSAAGFTVLAIAGGLAASGMAELDACKPYCRKEQADDTQTKATVANIGLAFGIAGAVTGAGIWIVTEATSEAATEPRMGAGILWTSEGPVLRMDGTF